MDPGIQLCEYACMDCVEITFPLFFLWEMYRNFLEVLTLLQRNNIILKIIYFFYRCITTLQHIVFYLTKHNFILTLF